MTRTEIKNLTMVSIF